MEYRAFSLIFSTFTTLRIRLVLTRTVGVPRMSVAGEQKTRYIYIFCVTLQKCVKKCREETTVEVGKELLFLSEKDVKACINMKKAIELCEKGERLTGQGKVVDDKFYLPIKEKLVFKPFAGYAKSGNIIASKIFTLSPNNPRKYGLPASSSIGLIHDANTVMPIAVLEASWLTGIKVGASSAVAAKYLAKKGSSIVGMIGAGIQARSHLEGLNEVFKIKEVRVASLTKEESERYAEEMSERFKIKVVAVDSIQKAVKGADIVVTVTTADEPLIKKESIEPGMLIIKIGSYREIDSGVITSVDKVIVDKWEYVSHRVRELAELIDEGVIRRQNIYAEIPEIVAGKKSGRENDEESILYVALGLGGDYATLFSYIYERALELGVGQRLKLLG